MISSGRLLPPYAAVRLIFVLLALLLSVSTAQTTLLVSGQEVAGLDQQTVPGVSYAPAQAYARVLGAGLEIGFSTVELRMGGRLLQLRLTGNPADATAPDSVAVDGSPVAGHAALSTGTGVLLPVKTVAEAFGGHVTVLGGSRDAVEVRLPTASVTALERSRSAASERLVVTLSAPVPVRTYFNERLNVLQLHFSHTRQPVIRALEGDAFLQAGFLQGSQDEPELRVSLAPAAGYSITSQPVGTGWQLVIAFVPAAAAPAGPAEAPGDEADPLVPADRSVLLDPGARTDLVDLALAVATYLRDAGVQVTLTRTSAAQQTTTLLGAASVDIHLSIAAGSRDALHVLGDVTSEAGLRQAAELAGGDLEQVERLRRELLLNRGLDLQAGAGSASAIGEQLGLSEPPVSLPLAGLLPAGGKGVRLVLAAGRLQDPGLAERLATGLLRALEAR